jgi:quinoprotein dehydrogenase-associated probable ABC transporter substrate-binding protein
MCSASHSWRRAIAVSVAAAAVAATLVACSRTGAARGTADGAVLRVCADPNNLPFTNERKQGFENRLAELVADEMGATLAYTWWPQRRGFVRETLNAGKCDVIMGVPARYDLVATTRPYYRSTYVFLSRRDRDLHLQSLDDPRLRQLRIGVHLIGDDGANTPPAHALSRRGIVGNLAGFSIYGDYAQPNPPARIVDAVADESIDVAIAWGPLAGYFAKQSRVALDVVPVQPHNDPALPFEYDIAMGVRRGDDELRARLDGILERRAEAIAGVLDDFGIPRVEKSR